MNPEPTDIEIINRFCELNQIPASPHIVCAISVSKARRFLIKYDFKGIIGTMGSVTAHYHFLAAHYNVSTFTVREAVNNYHSTITVG